MPGECVETPAPGLLKGSHVREAAHVGRSSLCFVRNILSVLYQTRRSVSPRNPADIKSDITWSPKPMPMFRPGQPFTVSSPTVSFPALMARYPRDHLRAKIDKLSSPEWPCSAWLLLCIGVSLLLALPTLLLLSNLSDPFLFDSVPSRLLDSAHEELRVPEFNKALFSSRWELQALSRVLLHATVTRTVHLEDQMLLVLSAPCSAQPILQWLHSGQPQNSFGTQFWSAALPWSCAFPVAGKGKLIGRSSRTVPYRDLVDGMENTTGAPQSSSSVELMELTPLRAVTARARSLFVRCSLPALDLVADARATLVLTKEQARYVEGESSRQDRYKGEERLAKLWMEAVATADSNDSNGIVGGGDTEPDSTAKGWSRRIWNPNALLGNLSEALGVDVPDCTPELLPLVTSSGPKISPLLKPQSPVERASGAGGAEAESANPRIQELQDAGSGSVREVLGRWLGWKQLPPLYLPSAALVHAPGDKQLAGQRLVMEALPQHDAIMLFSRGVAWEQKANGGEVNVECVFGGEGKEWRAPVKEGGGGLEGAIACPYPPPDVARQLAQLALNSSSGESEMQESRSGDGEVLPIPLTLQDKGGQLPSLAFWQPQRPPPLPWGRGPCSDSPLAHNQSADPGQGVLEANHTSAPSSEAYVPRERRYLLCACTQLWHKARFLREWTLYHSWLGVEHFFLYDNNSDDDVYEVALDLAGVPAVPGPFEPQPQRSRGNETQSEGQERDQSRDQGRKRVGVTVVPWPWLKTQEMANAHCLLLAGPHCDWVMFNDVDEFFFPYLAAKSLTQEDLIKARASMGPFLPFILNQSQGGRCPQVAMLSAAALSFGPNGHWEHPREGVALGYTCRMGREFLGKSIVKPSAVREGLPNWVHAFGTHKTYSHFSNPGQWGVFFHYQFQAWEDYQDKFYRRNSGGIRDWLSYPPGARGDGVVVEKDKSFRPPPDFAWRYCEVNDTRMADLVKLVFSSSNGSQEVLPWQDKKWF